MNVRVSRLEPTESVLIDVKDIWEESLCWIKYEKEDNPYKGVHPKETSFYILKCQIDYGRAVELGLTRKHREHIDIAARANVYLYAKNNREKDCKEGYQYLCKLAGRKPARWTGVPYGKPPCTKKILEELGVEKHLRADIRRRLMDLGYDEKTIRRAFKRLENTGRVSFSVENHSLKNCEVWAIRSDSVQAAGKRGPALHDLAGFSV